MIQDDDVDDQILSVTLMDMLVYFWSFLVVGNYDNYIYPQCIAIDRKDFHSNGVFMFMKNMLWVAIPSHLCLYNLCCSILLHKELGHLFPKINAQVQTLCGQHFHLFYVICQSVLVFKTWGKWTSCNTTSVMLYAIKFLVYADVIIVIIVFFFE